MSDETAVPRWWIGTNGRAYQANPGDSAGIYCLSDDVAKLEAQLAEESDECVKWRDQASENERDVTRLLAENARLREALTVISRENFTSDECGEIADEALEETDD